MDDPLLQELSPQDRQAYLDGMDGFASYLGVEDPDPVRIVRWVATEEQGIVVDECLARVGYPPTEYGHYWDDALREALYICHASYPVLPRHMQAWGEEQVELQYEWTVKYIIPCLQREGYSVGDAPSKAVFIDTWGSDPFLPFARLPSTTNTEQRRLNNVCPQMTPGAILFDGVSIDDWIAANRPDE